MSELTPRLGLPLLMAAQAQKHVTHNEALIRLDQIAQLTVEDFAAILPPADPTEGQVWALGPAPAGAWAGQGGDLALWFDGAWQFVTPAPGWRAAQGAALRIFDGADWVAPDLPDLQDLPGVGINATHDPTNRLTVAAPATLLTHEGAGHQLKINKAASGDTASLLYQTGFSGRAEMGTAGSDDFSVKVSPDGAAWHDGLVVNRTSGAVSLPNGLSVSGALTLPAGGVTRAALADGAALSLIGRPSNSVGVVADIPAGTDHQVLRRDGTSIGFGSVALNQAAAVTGTLPIANGGTGGATQAAARTGLGLGTAATATVTTSTTDTAANRLLKVSDFGLGAVSTPVLDNVDATGTVTGWYSISSPSTGTVPTNFGFLLNLRRGGAAIVQLFWSTINAGRGFRRYYDGSAWSVWSIVYDQSSILGTVSQSGGVPTGAVIQRGSNANGEFLRFADGTLICTHSASVSLAIDTAHLGGFRSVGQTWTYPSAFVAAPAVSVLARNLTAFGGISANTPVTGSMQWAVTAVTTQTAATRDVALTAIGRWF